MPTFPLLVVSHSLTPTPPDDRLVYSLMVDNRVLVYDNLVTVGNAERNIDPPSVEEVMQLCGDSLCRFKDLPNGKISGKTATHKDDMAMAMLINMDMTAEFVQRAARGAPVFSRQISVTFSGS